MSLTSDNIYAELTSLGVDYDVYEHEAVLTVEAQAAAVAGNDGSVTKNLFLRDKKNRLYVITAAIETKVDLKVLSARLGVGKGGLRFAPENLLETVLQVPNGCVTPLSACQPSASCVVLLLDRKLKGLERVLVHPLTNTATLSIPPSGLDAILRSHDREPIYVDLEASPPINKDNPPDLKEYADQAQPCQVDTSVNPAPSSSGQARGDPAMSVNKKGRKPHGAQSVGGPQTRGDDVKAMTARLLNMFNVHLGGNGDQLSSGGSTALQRLMADVEMEVNAFRNAAYARGYAASRDQIKAACSAPSG